MNQELQKREWMRDRWSRWFLIVGLILNAASWVIIWRFMPRNLDVSPLHYTIYFGINLTGHWSRLFWLPAVGTTAIVSHLVIVQLVNHLIWHRLWLMMTLIINVIMVIDLTAILIFIRSTSF